MSLLNRALPRLNARVNMLYRALRLYCSNGSARAWAVALRHLCRRMLGETVPPFITIAPTYRCPCRCVHCAVVGGSRSEGDELTTSEIKSIIDQARQLGVLQVTFTGGEPLLRSDIPELVRYCHDAGLLTRINTCGLLLDGAYAARLKQAGLTQCAVSIDDADPEVHDRLRGVPGAHRKALDSIRVLRQFGILCQINTYASRRNVTAGLERIIALGRRLGVLAVYIILPTAIGRWDEAFAEVLTEEEKARVRGLQDATFVHLELSTPDTQCGACSKGVIFVSPVGEVTPCPFVPYVFGNIREHRLEDFWRRHCASAELQCRGDCPMNLKGQREALSRHVESVARSMR